MATAVRSALSNPKARSAIARRAGQIAKVKIAEAAKSYRDRLKRVAPALSKDVIEAYVIPGATGVVGAIGVDMVLDQFKPLAGAKGDISKILAGITAGTVGRQVLKGNKYVHGLAMGVVIVNTYKLATRVMNRTVAGKGMAGLLTDGSNQDLAGFPEDNGWEPVNILLADGTTTQGFQDAQGYLYDANGAQIVADGGEVAAPALQGLPFYDLPAGAKTGARITAGDHVVN